MEFEGFDFDNFGRVEEDDEERCLRRITTGFITIQQAYTNENRLIKKEDIKIKKQKKDQCRLSKQCTAEANFPIELQMQKQSLSHRICGSEGIQQCEDRLLTDGCNSNCGRIGSSSAVPLQYAEEQDEDESDDDSDDSQYLLEDEILLDLDFFNRKGEQNIEKNITEKVSIWNDVRPVIQVVTKSNRIEIIYDNGHRLLKDFKFLIKKLENYKDSYEAKLASKLLQEHQKNIEHEEKVLDRIMQYYDHEKNILFDRISQNYEKSKVIAYQIIDQNPHPYFAFSIRKLNCEGGIQHLSGPFGYSKPLIEIFGGDMETYVRFIMRKGVIEHFDRKSHFIIFLMKLRIICNTELNVVTLDNIKIPISVTLERHSLSRVQIMPNCFKEDYIKIYKIEFKNDILTQLYEMRRSKENFQNSIQGLEDFEYFMQSQIFYDKFYQKKKHTSDQSKACKYRYLDRLQSHRYMGKSQRKYFEDYVVNFSPSIKRKHKSTCQKRKLVQINKEAEKDNKQPIPTFHHDISVESQTIKQEDSGVFELNDDKQNISLSMPENNVSIDDVDQQDELESYGLRLISAPIKKSIRKRVSEESPQKLLYSQLTNH